MSETTIKIAVLASQKVPATSYLVEALEDAGFPASVIFDEKVESDKDLAIWAERTEGRLPRRYFEPDYVVESHNDCLDLVRNFDMLINGGTLNILKPPILNATKYGVLNIHPGALPMYRGCSAVEWAIYNDEIVANTVHYMNERIDEGPIVMREAYTFDKGSSYADIRIQVYKEGWALLPKAIEFAILHGLTKDTAEIQGEGTYYKPIGLAEMAVVLEKINSGNYKFLQA